MVETLPDHPRRDDVTAVLVEADPVNVAWARQAAAAAGLAEGSLQTMREVFGISSANQASLHASYDHRSHRPPT